jgi:membrane protein
MMAGARRGLAAAFAGLPRGPRRILRGLGRVIAGTFRACVKNRVMGLSGEAAFFAILSLPPLIFALAGAIGFIAQRYDVATVANFREQVLLLAGRALTPDAVSGVIAPTLDEVLGGGRFEVVSIGFLIALWSGSRALSVFVDTISIMYGLGGHRGIIRTRALSFLLYLVFLIAGVVLLPLVLAGPSFIHQVLPEPARMVADLYWPIVLLLSVCLLATAYHLSVPVRTRWRADVPGAILALLIWLAGGAGLRVVLDASAGATSVYGPLAAPIALLFWLYVSSLAVLIGAAFNAALDEVWPALSGIHGNRASKVSDYLDKQGD